MPAPQPGPESSTSTPVMNRPVYGPGQLVDYAVQSGDTLPAEDFAPATLGCAVFYHPVVAMADGIVARSEGGVVIEDLDGDGNERTGWNILYLHIAPAGQSLLGRSLKKGDILGYPSCEGSNATGTHVHVARKYNGEWMPVDGAVAFNLEGWVAHAGVTYYQGTLVRDNQTVTASFSPIFARLIQAGQ